MYAAAIPTICHAENSPNTPKSWMNTERLYIVTYDIADQRRWRRVFKIMQGYGDWLLLSVVQWHLTARHRAGLETARITFCWSMLALPNRSSRRSPASADALRESNAGQR